MIVIKNPHFRQFNSIEKRLPLAGENFGPKDIQVCKYTCYTRANAFPANHHGKSTEVQNPKITQCE